MKVQRLKKKLEKSSDRLNIFADKKFFRKYVLSDEELYDIINEFLTDEQKARLFEFEHFKKLLPYKKIDIVVLIKDDKIKLRFLEDEEFLACINKEFIFEIIDTLQDNVKMTLLHNKEFIEKYKINNFYYIKKIILSLSESNKEKLLSDKDFLQNQLGLDKEYEISEIVASIKDENEKLNMMDFYDFQIIFVIVDILVTFPDKYKETILIENRYDFKAKDYTIQIVSSMSTDFLVNFFNKHNKFLEEKGVMPYEIIKKLDSEKQLEFISKFEELELSVWKKRQILAVLKQETKDNIDISNYPEEYKIALEMKLNEKGKVVLDLDGDLEKYRNLQKYNDLDEVIYINPMLMSSKEKEKLMQLLEIYPNARIHDDIDLMYSTVEEYRNGEAWIESVIKGINPNWIDIQKIAYIDNAIGKKISYSPDYNTEVSNKDNARALWKIINSGYGVCNGISQVEFYILKQIGIDVEIVSSGNHSFIKLSNIEIPNENGEYIKCNTILDPTWNLAAHRYGGKPSYFCRSYEKIRKDDIEEDGKDCLAHKNDEKLSDCTLNLDDKILRKIYSSIGLASKDGKFLMDYLIEESKLIDGFNLPEGTNIEMQLIALEKYYPEFATCQNSTMKILADVLLANDNFKYKQCVVNRVYNKKDENKEPVAYIYVDFPKAGKKFYYADKEIKQFIKLSQKEFEERFECYEMDMQGNIEKNKCARPWKTVEKETIIEDLSRNQIKEVAQEGGER